MLRYLVCVRIQTIDGDVDYRHLSLSTSSFFDVVNFDPLFHDLWENEYPEYRFKDLQFNVVSMVLFDGLEVK